MTEKIRKEPYERRPGDGNQDTRARKFTKGIRLKLRTKLRSLGVQGKFRTDEYRSSARYDNPFKKTILVVVGAVSDKPLTEFEGRMVIYRS